MKFFFLHNLAKTFNFLLFRPKFILFKIFLVSCSVAVIDILRAGDKMTADGNELREVSRRIIASGKTKLAAIVVCDYQSVAVIVALADGYP